MRTKQRAHYFKLQEEALKADALGQRSFRIRELEELLDADRKDGYDLYTLLPIQFTGADNAGAAGVYTDLVVVTQKIVFDEARAVEREMKQEVPYQTHSFDAPAPERELAGVS